jgi:CheY-like chemotaxis protein
MLLADRTVVVVDPDAHHTDIIAQHLRAHGARCFHARDASTAAWAARETLPDVVVSELELPDLSGSSLILELRRSAECAGVPAIGLTGNRSLIARGQTDAPSFEKYLPKPVDATDLLDAVCCVIGSRGVPAPGASPTVEELGRRIERHDYRSLLGALNATTSYRYTALLRVQGDELHSVWTFNRAEPALDPFSPRVLIADTPCAALLATQRPVACEDTGLGEQIAREQRHAPMRAFAGVPVFDDSNVLVGALCHFDPHPRADGEQTLDLLERVARLFLFVNPSRRSSTPRPR